MSLDIAKHQAELAKITKALTVISDRHDSPGDTPFFHQKKRTCQALSKGLESIPSWCLQSTKIMRERADDLAGLCDALSDHVSSPEGERFWKDQKAFLLGLADTFQEWVENAEKQADESPENTTRSLQLSTQ